jgi:H+/Cl- antiporter ClcA
MRALRCLVLAVVSGAMAGVASFAFLEALDWATDTRLEDPWLLWLLPVAGLAIGAAYHLVGGRAALGNALLLDEIHRPTAWVPRRMAPLVFGGTVVSHLFGASVGREGTALQMSGSLTDGVSRVLRIGPVERRILLVASLAGGFGAVFGVPLAGTVFALEVQALRRLRFVALVPAAIAAFVGHAVVGFLGHDHSAKPTLSVDLDAVLLAKVALAGAMFGLVARAFVWLTHVIKRNATAHVAWPPLRPAIGGVATLALVALFGRDYLGLSLPLIDGTLAGIEPSQWAFALKVVFTAVALGFGFPGGEVTPLFVIGTTLGATLAGPLGLGTTMLASVGFVGVFAGAANTPLACAVMGAELFGAGSLPVMAVGCLAAFATSPHHGIYGSRRERRSVPSGA